MVSYQLSGFSRRCSSNNIGTSACTRVAFNAHQALSFLRNSGVSRTLIWAVSSEFGVRNVLATVGGWSLLLSASAFFARAAAIFAMELFRLLIAGSPEFRRSRWNIHEKCGAASHKSDGSLRGW